MFTEEYKDKMAEKYDKWVDKCISDFEETYQKLVRETGSLSSPCIPNRFRVNCETDQSVNVDDLLKQLKNGELGGYDIWKMNLHHKLSKRDGEFLMVMIIDEIEK